MSNQVPTYTVCFLLRVTIDAQIQRNVDAEHTSDSLALSLRLMIALWVAKGDYPR